MLKRMDVATLLSSSAVRTLAKNDCKLIQIAEMRIFSLVVGYTIRGNDDARKKDLSILSVNKKKISLPLQIESR